MLLVRVEDINRDYTFFYLPDCPALFLLDLCTKIIFFFSPPPASLLRSLILILPLTTQRSQLFSLLLSLWLLAPLTSPGRRPLVTRGPPRRPAPGLPLAASPGAARCKRGATGMARRPNEGPSRPAGPLVRCGAVRCKGPPWLAP